MDDSLSLSEVDHLRTIYQQIVCGYSYSSEQKLYIKHLNELENIEVLNMKFEFLKKFNKDGMLTYKEKLTQIIEQEQWSKEKEEEIAFHQQLIADNQRHLKTVIPVQRPPIEKMIQDSKEKEALLLEEKDDLIGSTAEQFAERNSYNYFVYLSFYKDTKLKEKFFGSFQEFDDLEYEELAVYVKVLDSVLCNFKENSIKKIATLPSFINVFAYAKEDISKFFGKPISELTSFQILLCSLGLRNIDILQKSEGEPPDLIGDVKIVDVVDWYDKNYSVLTGKQSGNQGGVTKTIREVVKR